MTVKDMRMMAKAMGIKGYYKMNKAELDNAIDEAIEREKAEEQEKMVALYEAREAELDRRDAEAERNRREVPGLLKEAEEIGLIGLEWMTADGIRKEIEKAKAERAEAETELEKFWNEPINEMGTRIERIEMTVTLDVLGWTYDEESENAITFTNPMTGKERTLHSYSAVMDYVDMALEGKSPRTIEHIDRMIKLDKSLELVVTAQNLNVQDAEGMTDAELIESIRSMQSINRHAKELKQEELENIVFTAETKGIADETERLELDTDLIWESLGCTRDMKEQDSFVYYWNPEDNSRTGFTDMQAAHKAGRMLLINSIATKAANKMYGNGETPDKVLAEPVQPVPTVTEVVEIEEFNGVADIDHAERVEDAEAENAKLSELTETIIQMDNRIKDLKKVVQDLVQVINDMKKPDPDSDPTPDKPEHKDSTEEKAPEKGPGEDLKKVDLEKRGRAQADERMKSIGYTRVESPEGFEEMECYENDNTHKLKFFNSYGAALNYARKEEERRIDRKNKDMAVQEMRRRGYHPTKKPINGRYAFIHSKTGDSKLFNSYHEVLEWVVSENERKTAPQSDEKQTKDKLHAEPKKDRQTVEKEPKKANTDRVVTVTFPTVAEIRQQVKNGTIKTVTLKAFTGMELGEYPAKSLMFDKGNTTIRLITRNGKKLDFDATGKQKNAKKASYANTLIFNR